jgi:hypothetical protein
MAILQISYASGEYIAILQISYASGEYIAIPKWPMPVRNIAIRVWHMLVTCTGRKKTLRPGSVYFRNEYLNTANDYALVPALVWKKAILIIEEDCLLVAQIILGESHNHFILQNQDMRGAKGAYVFPWWDFVTMIHSAVAFLWY